MNQTQEEKFGKVVRKYRIEYGATSKVIAEKIGISAAYLSDIEKGYRIPSNDVIIKISQAIVGVSSNYLFYLAGRVPPILRNLNPTAEVIDEWCKKLFEKYGD